MEGTYNIISTRRYYTFTRGIVLYHTSVPEMYSIHCLLFSKDPILTTLLRHERGKNDDTNKVTALANATACLGGGGGSWGIRVTNKKSPGTGGA